MRLHPRWRYPAAITIGALILQGCDDGTPASPDVLANNSREAAAADADTTLSVVVRAVALALADEALRMQVLHDLRDSPFPEHKIHLRSYLAGERGRPLAAGAARAARVSVEGLGSLLRSLPDLEIAVPLAGDRVRWAGDGSVVVVGTLLDDAQLARMRSVTGYSASSGEAVTVPVGQYLPYPLLAITRAAPVYGRDPEARRRSAPKRSHRTIGTAETELWTNSVDEYGCVEGEDPLQNCGITSVPMQRGLRLPSNMTTACFQSGAGQADRDEDGLLDSCEAEIAYAFRPHLQFHSADIYRSREEYWAAKQSGPGEVQVFYAFAYHYDVGVDIAFDSFEDHTGDSEFVVFEIRQTGNGWELDRAFLSAHYKKWGWDASSTRDGSVFEYPNRAYRTRPKIWIAKDKHANYHSQDKCDEGANYYDTCDAPQNQLFDFEVAPEYNLGNKEAGVPLLLEIYSRDLFHNTAIENFWADPEFRGWDYRDMEAAAGPYRDWLDDFDF